MYPYHNRIKQRIKAGELVDYEFVQDYKDIGECLVLYFSTEPEFGPLDPPAMANMLICWRTSKRPGREKEGGKP